MFHMNLTSVAAASTLGSQGSLLQQVGMSVMNMSMDADQIQGAREVAMIQSAPAPSLDPNVGTRFDASV